MKSGTHYRWFIYCGTGLLVLAFLVLSAAEFNVDFLIKEGGLIESASAAGYFLIVGYLLFKGGADFARKHSYFFLLILLFGFRELDFDKQFTTMGIFKSRFYLNPEIPTAEKLFGVTVICCGFWAVYVLCRIHLKAFVEGLKNHKAESIGALIVLMLLVIAKTLDGISRKLASIGFEGARAWTHQFAVFEEILELGIPLFMLLSFIIHFQKRTDAIAEKQTA